MQTCTYTSGQIAYCADRVITESSVASLAPHHPARRLVGCVVDWDAEPVYRCPGDDPHWPGTIRGRRIYVSRRLGYYWAG